MVAIFWALAGCMSAAVLASRADVLQEHNIPLNLALDIAQDAEGVLRALLRADNAAIHTPEAARRKAYTAASARTATSAMVKNIQNPGAAQLVGIDDFLILAGGLPIKLGNETIGAIGVGGAPGGDLDEACAMVALEKAGKKLA
ncbi:hypothetical protein ACCO45_007363 [Purpureocillium lilacinum]|uniref:Uncharacterized protein n=1 Tax=Purpureocillium lilacinum TaxID=33203 RepID=A0ACC4DUW2_PURLI